MVLIFILGIAVDLWFSNRLGQTSLILLLAAGFWRFIKNWLPQKTREVHLK